LFIGEIKKGTVKAVPFLKLKTQVCVKGALVQREMI
jgi:hypothetical protein